MKTLALEGLEVSFGAIRALAGVSLEVKAGEILMLAGPNGAGKSTLLHVLLGLVRPGAGTLRIDGVDKGVDLEHKRALGYLPEAVAFAESLTGAQVLRFFGWARGVPGARQAAVLARVGLSHAAHRSVRGYSRGMRQRLGLAVAVLSDPELLLLDEPAGGLDQEGLRVLWSILEEWRDAGRTVILSTHDLALFERRVDRMCVLLGGVVVALDSPGELRRASGLPLRVRMDLAEDERAADLVEAVCGLGGAKAQREGDHLNVEVAPDGLLAVMDLQARFSEIVQGLRVEEPPLDLVYERLITEHG